jgi:hypothetical protein
MYGMVNKAVQNLVLSAHGADVWERVRIQAGIEETNFLSMQSYPDEITYNLVDAICVELSSPPEPVLELFGDSWVGYASSQGYGPMLDFFGKDMRSLLRNLDALHVRLKAVFPHLRPPALGCEELAPDRYRLHYVSHRSGLTHFVVGLIRGMARRFDEVVSVEIENLKAEGAEHDTFLITIGQNQIDSHAR